jgi:hypothetical protein
MVALPSPISLQAHCVRHHISYIISWYEMGWYTFKSIYCSIVCDTGSHSKAFSIQSAACVFSSPNLIKPSRPTSCTCNVLCTAILCCTSLHCSVLHCTAIFCSIGCEDVRWRGEVMYTQRFIHSNAERHRSNTRTPQPALLLFSTPPSTVRTSTHPLHSKWNKPEELFHDSKWVRMVRMPVEGKSVCVDLGLGIPSLRSLLRFSIQHLTRGHYTVRYTGILYG